MRTIILTLSLLAAVGGLTTTATHANIFCVDFLDFCDGLEIQIEGDAVGGIWRNRLCDGIDSPLVGVIEDGIPNPCVAETGKLGLACIPALGCDQIGIDDEWYYVFNEPNGRVDVGHSTGGILPPPGGCVFLEGVHYQFLPGPCPFGPESEGEAISSEEALR